MKSALFIMFLLLSLESICQQKSFTITLTDNNGNPINLVGKQVTIQVQKKNGQTSYINPISNGIYTINAESGDVFIVSSRNNQYVQTIVLTDEKAGNNYNQIIDLSAITNIKQNTSTSAASTRNYWVGAKVAYNLNGSSTEDIVGGSKIVINPSNIFEDERNYLNIIGNVGTFFSNTGSTDDGKETEAAISKLVQSQTGLGLGVGYLRELRKKDAISGNFNSRIEVTTNYRLNSFKDPQVDTATIGLNQWRSTLLYEIELGGWGKKGVASLAFEGSLSVFSASTYERIFNESRSNRFSFETTLILPISENIGFMVNLITTSKVNPIYQFGIAIKTGD